MARAFPLATEEIEEKYEAKDFFEFRKGWSRVKHSILSRYLDAWIPIMCQNKYFRGKKIVYVDGFAGPGVYSDGSDGSPLLVYKKAIEHRSAPDFNHDLLLYFIEIDKKKAEKLKNNLEQVKITAGCPKHVEFHVRTGKFVHEMQRILNEIYVSDALLVFVDPFGFNGAATPMTLLRGIVARVEHAPTELFINVMDGYANRFFKLDSRAQAINLLVGTDVWKAEVIEEGLTPAERLERFMNVYWDQLKKGTTLKLKKLTFGMRSDVNRHLYHLLFVTRHIKGIDEMKNAMWSETQLDDGFEFSEFREGKQTIPNYRLLTAEEKKVKMLEMIIEKLQDVFRNKQRVSGLELAEYILTETIYKFNVRNELKKKFARFIVEPSRTFDEIIFNFEQF